MRYTHIRQSDLNLLVSLQALVEERSVTRAASRMFSSQSAMSRTLDRLRKTFKDELLVRTVNGYEPTHRALHLYAELEHILPKIDRLLHRDEFNPAEAKDSFRIAAADYAAIVLLPKLMQTVARTAPGVQFEISNWDRRRDIFRKLENNALDLVFSPQELTGGFPSSLLSESLFRERMVCLLRKGHPLSKRPLTLERYLNQCHVVISFPESQQILVGKLADRYGWLRSVPLKIPYFASVSSIIEQTDWIATLPERLARYLAARSKTCIARVPKEFHEINNFIYCQVWHPRYDSDPAHRWLRDLIRKVSAGI